MSKPRKPNNTLRKTLRMEGLERRDLLSGTTTTWPDPRHLTLSMVPDGTKIAGHSSSLFATLDAQFPRAFWQKELARAFQHWAVQTNLDIGQIADGGQALGATGKYQHDDRFGDIRIAAQPMSAGSFSISVPGDPGLAGTLSGDVFLNSNIDFRAPGSSLFSVLLHEAGHALGLDHSTDPNSVMYSHSGANRTSLAPSDVAAIQALYGQRSADANELQKPNDTFKEATRIKYSEVSDGFTGATPLLSFGDLTTTKDVDIFWVSPLSSYTGPMTFRLQSQGLSFLAPKLTLMDEAGNVLKTAFSRDAGGIVSLTLPSVNPQVKYFAKVENITTGVFGIGRYALVTTFDDRLTVNEATITKMIRNPLESVRNDDVVEAFQTPDDVQLNDDLHLNDTLITAQGLKTTPGYAEATHYETVASIADALDADYYRVKAYKPATGGPVVLTVSVTSLNLNSVETSVTIVDGNGVAVASKVLANGNGTYRVQAANLQAGGSYFIKVAPAPFQSTVSTGNYSLVADFGSSTAALQQFGSGVASKTSPQTGKLYIAQDQMFQFLLTGASAAPSNVTLNFTLKDSAGKVVAVLAAHGGETRSTQSVFLVPGEYNFAITVVAPAGTTPPAMRFSLEGARLSQPIGPAIDDPTLAPRYVYSTSPLRYAYPPGVITAANFYFYFATRLIP